MSKTRQFIIICLIANSGNGISQPSEKAVILLFGTAHKFNKELILKQDFNQIRETLVNFHPDLICIESIPTWDTLSLMIARSNSLDTAKDLRTTHFPHSIDIKQKIDSLIMKVEKDPTNLIQRSILGNLLFANNDFYNAYYHWWYVYEQTLKGNQAESEELKETFVLNNIHQRKGERETLTEFGNIIYPLSNKLNIHYLENIDERSEDSVFQTLGRKVMWRLLFNLKGFSLLRKYNKLRKLTELAECKGKLIALINSESYRRQLTKIIDEFDTRWVRGRPGQKLIETWNRRNNRMAERILDIVNSKKPTKIIVAFGSAHIDFVKRYLEKDGTIEVVTYEEYVSNMARKIN